MKLFGIYLTPLLMSLVSAQPSGSKPGHIRAIKEFAWHAALARCPYEQLANWTCKSCKQVPSAKFITSFDNDEFKTRGVLAVDEAKRSLIVSFRGGENEVNQANSNQVELVSFDNDVSDKGKVHDGFKKSMESLAPQFTSEIKQALEKYQDFNIVVTGHSLGGAIASLAVDEIRKKLEIPDTRLELITYGQPMVGDADFAKWFNQQAIPKIRVINKNDITPHNLIERPSLGYRHFDGEVWVKREDEVTFCKSIQFEDPSCSVSIPQADLTKFDHHSVFDTTFGTGAC